MQKKQREREREREQSQNEEVSTNMITAQEWLNQEYPTLESRKQETELIIDDISSGKLTGELDLSDFVNLESLVLNNKQITTLNLTKNTKLTYLCVDFCNQLTTIQGLENCPYLKEIYVDQCPNLQPPYTFLEAWKEEIAQLKAQLQETQELNQKLQQDNQELLKDIHTYKQTIQGLENQLQDSQQRILALEADKSDLIKNLGEQKQKYHHHLNQEKSHLTKEIQLIKEVIHE